jgi:hypothetical protein
MWTRAPTIRQLVFITGATAVLDVQTDAVQTDFFGGKTGKFNAKSDRSHILQENGPIAIWSAAPHLPGAIRITGEVPLVLLQLKLEF